MDKTSSAALGIMSNELLYFHGCKGGSDKNSDGPTNVLDVGAFLLESALSSSS